MADTAGYSPDLSFEQKVELLEALDVETRLEKALEWAKETLADLTLKEKVREDVAEGMDKTQREFLLRQQLAAIRKELGDGEDGGDIVEEYRAKIEAANMPEGPRAEAERELGRLERTNEQSPEYGWIRTYLDWMTELPWDVRSEDVLDIPEARRILDEDHTGLEDVKDRIVEYLAVRKLRQERGLGAATAGAPAPSSPSSDRRASGRRRSARAWHAPSVASSSASPSAASTTRPRSAGTAAPTSAPCPGRIVRALKEAGTKNPVFMLDEIDKVGSDWRGDPSSALLEVLDPAQNHSFRDHYLEVDLDLSEVLFIATGNVAETIPGPLIDRMEVIRLDGYTEDEKVAISRDHLLARQLERNGLKSERGRARPI